MEETPQWILRLKEYSKNLPEANSEAILESDRNSGRYAGIFRNPETGTREKISISPDSGGKINY